MQYESMSSDMGLASLVPLQEGTLFTPYMIYSLNPKP